MPPWNVTVAVMVQLPDKLLPAAAVTTCQSPFESAQQQYNMHGGDQDISNSPKWHAMFKVLHKVPSRAIETWLGVDDAQELS